MLATALARRAGATSSRLGCPVSTGRNSLCLSSLSMPHTGEPVAFDRHSGVDLVDAVAASTSNGFGPFPPYRIGENRYINGGYRRSENADLAAGYRRVLVLSPFGGRSRMPLEWGRISQPSRHLRARGSRVETASRMAARATCSTPMRRIRQRVCRPREEATTKAEPHGAARRIRRRCPNESDGARRVEAGDLSPDGAGGVFGRATQVAAGQHDPAGVIGQPVRLPGGLADSPACPPPRARTAVNGKTRAPGRMMVPVAAPAPSCAASRT